MFFVGGKLGLEVTTSAPSLKDSRSVTIGDCASSVYMVQNDFLKVYF